MYRGDILATLPKDEGKVLYYSNSQILIVEDGQICERCNKAPAVVVVQGETDSFGYEPEYSCLACSQTEDDDGSDVEDRAPKEGHLFVVCETTNHDVGKDFFCSSSSYRDAVLYLRDCRNIAERWAGLYPNKGVQEWSMNQVSSFKEEEKLRRKQEMEDLDMDF